MFSALISRVTAGLAAHGLHGLVGVAAYEGVKKVTGNGVVHGTAVTVTSWGLRGVRAIETGAETTRLAARGILSEARERIGEQTPKPGAVVSVPHEH